MDKNISSKLFAENPDCSAVCRSSSRLPSNNRRPWLSIPTSSAINSISDSMCEEIRIVQSYRPGSDLIRFRISWIPAGSSPFVGSSKIKIGGRPNKAPASPNRCFIPNEYFLASRPPNSERPTSSSASVAALWERPKIRRIMSRFSAPVRLA